MSVPLFPVQIVYFLEGGNNTLPNWYIQVLNTEESFQFVGTTAAEQQASIETLCTAMQENDVNYLVQCIGEEIIIPSYYNAGQLVNILFGETNSLIFQADTVYSVTNGTSVLIDYLEPAGSALEDALEAIGWIFA